MVSEAAGCSIAQSKEASMTWKFSANVAKSISAEVLLGLDYVHSCGVVHSVTSSSPFLGARIEPLTQKQIYIGTIPYL